MSEVENQEVETQEPSAVTELINQITSGDLANAEGSFKSLVQDKMSVSYTHLTLPTTPYV